MLTNDGDDATVVVYTDATVPGHLRTDGGISVNDQTAHADRLLAALLPPVSSELRDEPPRWAYFPWRRTLVKIPGPQSYRRLRLDRNRHKLTSDDLRRAADLRIGVVGLSVGHAIALTLTLEGLAGELRLADFDDLEITNMNRVPTSIVDLGVNKSVAASRRISEIDPFMRVTTFQEGITEANIEAFVNGLDIVIEECDSFDVKVRIREVCRARGIPVLMETSDGGTLDVERFDLEPTRPLFHGLVGDIRAEDLASLDRAAATGLAAKILEPAKVTAPMAASALELGRTVTAWPQLGGDVLLGGATVAAAVRRLVQGRPLRSGRVRFDRDRWLDDITDPLVTATSAVPASEPRTTEPAPAALTDDELLRLAADRAPSAGNQKPWRMSFDAGHVTITLDPARTSTLDIGHRASAVAVGAALFNVELAARSRGRSGGTEIAGGSNPIAARVQLTPPTTAPPTEPLLDAILNRSTRRALGDATTAGPDDLGAMRQVAATAHTRLVALTERNAIGHLATILGASDRLRFLTPQLHAEMFDELTDDPDAQRGIQINALDLPPEMAAMTDVLRRGDVMALLDDWDAGAALAADATARAASASAFVAVIQTGCTTTDYLQAGHVVEHLWITAEQLGYQVHPMTPVFLYATDDHEAGALSVRHADELVTQRRTLLEMLGVGSGETPTILLRLSR